MMMLIRAPRSPNKMTYEEAVIYCKFCDHNGHNDWRMPDRSEYVYFGSYSMCWYDGISYPDSENYAIPVRKF